MVASGSPQLPKVAKKICDGAIPASRGKRDDLWFDFGVFLPLEAQEDVPAAQVVEKAAEPSGHLGLVLWVDDDPQVRMMAQTMLGHLGCQALAARDGFETVRLFRVRKE